MPLKRGPYLWWALRLITVGVAGLVGVGLFSPLLESTGVRNELKVDLPSFPDAKQASARNLLSQVPHSLMNSLYFSSFDGIHVFENRGSTGGSVARRPLGLERRMFEQLQEEVIGYLKGSGQQNFSQQDCNDIRYLLLPTAGLQVEVVCSKSSSSFGAERIVMLLPFHHSRVLLHTHVDATQKLSIVVSLQGRVEALQRFLSNLQKVVQDGGFHIVLTLVYFDDQQTQNVAAALEASRGIEGLHTQLVILQGKFSRSRGLKVGVERDTSGVDVVFLCDVDIIVTKKFLVRCLASPSQGDQVFFPVFFSQHNPLLTYSARGKKVPHTPAVKLADHHGYWRLWSYGMVCLYKSDFLKINGFDSHTTGWGGEDLRFARQVSAKGYSIRRSLDHGLFHLYHPKNCSRAGEGEQVSCLKVQATSEASGQTFGLLHFKKKYTTSMWSALEGKETREEEIDTQEERQNEDGMTNKEDDKKRDRNSLDILEDPTFLRAVVAVLVILNITLCGCLALACVGGCGYRRAPHTGPHSGL